MGSKQPNHRAQHLQSGRSGQDNEGASDEREHDRDQNGQIAEPAGAAAGVGRLPLQVEQRNHEQHSGEALRFERDTAQLPHAALPERQAGHNSPQADAQR